MAGRRVGLFPREMFLREKVFPGYLYGFRDMAMGLFVPDIDNGDCFFHIGFGPVLECSYLYGALSGGDFDDLVIVE